MCKHLNLEYSEAYSSVRCRDCGKVWRDESPVPIVYPNTWYPIYIPQTPTPPSYPTFPQYPYTVCQWSQ